MNTDAFDRFIRLLGRSGTRRSALGVLLGTALVGTPFSAVAKNKSKGKGRRAGRSNRGASSQAKTKPGNHCIHPTELVDLNEIYGISHQIVTRFCTEVGSGEKWITPGAPWIMNDSFEFVPDEFEPAAGATTPLEDFIAKFVQVKFVIDPGAKHEKTVVFPNNGEFFTGPGNLFPDIPENWDVVSPITLGTLKPLPVGEHAVRVFWTLSAMHCDGIGDSIDDNCLPEGEFVYTFVPAFEVVPGHNR